MPDEIEKAIASSEMCSQGVAESASAGAERESSDFAATIVRPPSAYRQVTMKRIMFDDITFPPDTVVPIDSDNGTKDIVMSLLVKRPEHRLGCAKAGGIANVYRHEWFEGFDLVQCKSGAWSHRGSLIWTRIMKLLSLLRIIPGTFRLKSTLETTPG